MVEIGTGKKSFPATFLSLICPGLGQVYLRKPIKASFLFLGTAVGVLLIYFNSLPVDSITDLLLVGSKENPKSRFGLKLKNPESEDYEYTISVILNSSDYKTIEKDIKVSSIGFFSYSILLIFTNAEDFEKTQTYKTIKKFEKRELKFRPVWQFRISGSLQALIIWAYSVWDGFLGYKGYRRKKSKEQKKEKT